jgi:hypothetical protein
MRPVKWDVWISFKGFILIHDVERRDAIVQAATLRRLDILQELLRDDPTSKFDRIRL